MTVTELSEKLRSRKLSAEEAAKAYLGQMEKREPEVGAYLTVTREAALETARKVDQKRMKGEELHPLAGIPTGIKDNICTKGVKTTCASRMLENFVPPYDAAVIERLKDCHIVMLGKLNMDEFAMGSTTENSYYQITKNPRDLTRVPGGSSGGAAACVAAQEAACAIGSDTGGSIRQPAAFCGVVGMKPTYGAVSRYGVVAFGSSLDQVGPFGRRVEDVALAMNALVAAGRDPYDSTSQDCPVDFLEHLEDPVEGRTVGVVPQLLEAEGLSREERTAIQQATVALEAQGARVVEVELPNIASAIAAYYVIAPCEAFSNLARFDGVRYGYQEPGCSTLAEQTSLSRAHGFGEEAKRRQMLGAYLLSSGVYDKYYYPAQQVRTLITADYARAYEKCDVILLPATPRTAFRFGEISDPTEMYASDMFTISNNIAGNGGISVPMGVGAESGLPVSVQLQGPAFKDRSLLTFARAIERSCSAEGVVAPAFAGKGGEL